MRRLPGTLAALGAAFLLAGPLAAQAKKPAKAAPEKTEKKETKPVAGPKDKKPAARPAAARPAVPEPPPAYALPEGPRVTLAEALRTTLERSPDVETARQDVRRSTGLVQEASGRFDPVLFFSPSLERQKTFLTESALRGEVGKREFLRDSATNLARIADDIASGLTDDQGRPLPDCKGSQYYVNGFPICTDHVSQTDYRTFELLQNAQDATAGNPQGDKLQQAITKSVNRRLSTILALIRRVFLPSITSQLANIGDLPRESETDTLNVDLRLMQPFRNGMSIGPILFLQGTRFAFSDKPDSPAFGGTGVPTLYRAVLGLSVDAPLLRGGGAGSAGAEERSAKLQREAASERLVQAASDAILGTTISYWNLAAAQELQKLLVKGSAAQRRIGELSRALVEGDELPRAELSRVDAHTADAEAAALQAGRSVAAARVELARAMGLDISRIEDAPLAADPLPSAADLSLPDAKASEALVARLAELRGDVRAARKRAEAARVLEHAARLDLRPRLDLSVQGGWNAFYEDPAFAINKAWNPTGYWRGFQESYVGPSIQVSLVLELPIGNGVQRGRLVNTEAFRAQTEIRARELERQAVNEARELAQTLPATARETRAREAAAAEAEKTVGTAYERFRAGETTLLDAVMTERVRTQALADLVGARQTLVLRDARLKWAAGALLPATRADGEVRFGDPAPPAAPTR